MTRLLGPTVVFSGVRVEIEACMNALDLGAKARCEGCGSATSPRLVLWFPAVYLALVILAPLTIHLHKRFGARTLAVLVSAVVAADLLTFGLDRPKLLAIREGCFSRK